MEMHRSGWSLGIFWRLSQQDFLALAVGSERKKGLKMKTKTKTKERVRDDTHTNERREFLRRRLHDSQLDRMGSSVCSFKFKMPFISISVTFPFLNHLFTSLKSGVPLLSGTPYNSLGLSWVWLLLTILVSSLTSPPFFFMFLLN